MHETMESPWATVIISAARGQVSLTESEGAGTCFGPQHRMQILERRWTQTSIRPSVDAASRLRADRQDDQGGPVLSVQAFGLKLIRSDIDAI